MDAFDSLTNVCVVVPAAGVGMRMGAVKPKQYLEIQGRTILEHTLSRIASLHPRRLVVAVAEDDGYYKKLPAIAGCEFVVGGLKRADSVLNGIAALDLQADDWVMVHDAVRPCVRHKDILDLREAVESSDIGGLLGVPVVDTVKQVEGNKTISTIDRSRLWRAQTPQLFRHGILKKALKDSSNATDEAAAVEHLGFKPIMVLGHGDNIKITTQEDLELAAYYLSREAA